MISVGCNVTTFVELGHAPKYFWSIPVFRQSMAVKDFQNFPSLQEVECSGRNLLPEVDFLSFVLYKVSDSSVLATLKTLKNECTTLKDYSSCTIHLGDSRLSVVRSLVTDLREGETTLIGCNVTSVLKNGHPRVFTWTVFVHRRSITVRDFQNFPSLQEVECSGKNLPPEVDFLSFVLYRISDNSKLATLRSPENTCTTFHEFSSCSFGSDRRFSAVRSLVADLAEGETTVIGCNVTSVYRKGHPGVYSWNVFVHRKRMTVQDFHNFPSLQEVECSGKNLLTEVDFLSLVLYKVSDNSVLATLKTPENTCTTLLEFSSCSFGSRDRRFSVVRSLVTDLEEGETTLIGCNVTSFFKKGHPGLYTWSVFVHRRSKV
ncbi:hypothetical protein ACOMHN_058943 [Nucella lapillus]